MTETRGIQIVIGNQFVFGKINLDGTRHNPSKKIHIHRWSLKKKQFCKYYVTSLMILLTNTMRGYPSQFTL